MEWLATALFILGMLVGGGLVCFGLEWRRGDERRKARHAGMVNDSWRKAMASAKGQPYKR